MPTLAISLSATTKSMRCSECDKEATYCGRFDSYLCTDCLVWLEPKCECADNECPFEARPDIIDREQLPFFQLEKI